MGTSASLVGAYTNNGGVSNIAIDATKVTLFTNGSAGTSVNTATGGILGATSSGNSYSVLGASTNIINVTGATGASVSTLTNMLSSVNSTISLLETAASTVGAAQEQIATQQTFVSTMSTNLSNGVASLVDADMNQVSTRLQALQTQRPADRDISTITVAFRTADLRIVREWLADARRQIQKLAQDTEAPDRVVQFNAQLFPVAYRPPARHQAA